MTTSSNPSLHKPKSIIVGINILYTTLGLGIINSIISKLIKTDENHFSILNLVVTIISILISFLLTRQISLGRKWARTTFLILFILGMLVFPGVLMTMFKMNFLIGIIAVVQTLLQIIALFFIFSKESSLWFNSMDKVKRQ